MSAAATYPPEAYASERARKLAALRERDPDWRDPQMVRRAVTLHRTRRDGAPLAQRPYYIAAASASFPLPDRPSTRRTA